MIDGIDATSHLDQARAALDAGDLDATRDQLDRATREARRLKDYSIRWIAELLSWIGETAGEAAVEAALRQFGDRYLADRYSAVRASAATASDGSASDGASDGTASDGRSSGVDGWWSVPAEVRGKVVARAMLANFADVDVIEDDEKIVMSFRCGSGGWLIDSGAYEGDDALLTLTDSGPRTFGRDSLPVYCAHCSVNNEMQAVERTGYLTTVEFPPERPGDPCVHHVYRSRDDIPEEIYVRIGKSRPPKT